MKNLLIKHFAQFLIIMAFHPFRTLLNEMCCCSNQQPTHASTTAEAQGGNQLIRLLRQGVELGNHQGLFAARHFRAQLAWLRIDGSLRLLVP